MKENDLKGYIGKVVTVRYRKQDDEIDSVQGEVLAVEQGVLCLGVNVANNLSGEVVRIVSIKEVVSVEANVNPGRSSERFLTIGNHYRYCSHLLNGTYLKSIGPATDFYAASEQYLLAMRSGFISDEIAILYLETVTGYLTNIRVDRHAHDEDLYKKELEGRIECFLKFRAFLNSDDISFKNLSDHAINKILTKLYIYKSSACAEKIFKTVYERYPKEYLVSDLDRLLELPKIVGSLLLFAMQTEAMYYLAKAQVCSVVEDREALYGKKSELDRLIDQCRIICQDKLEIYQAQDAAEPDFNLDLLVKCEQLSDMIKKVDDYKSKVSQEENKLNNDTQEKVDVGNEDLKPLMFSLVFDKIIKELNKTEEILSSHEKNPEKINLQSIKSRYDMSMAQFFNLFEYIALYEKDPEDEAESKWQIALQLMDIYLRKLQLISSYKPQEYSETKSKYRKAIKNSILNELSKDKNGNYFYACKRSKLMPLSDLLYEFELWEDYILNSTVLLDDSIVGKENKTPEEYRMLCYFQLASIYSSQEGSYYSNEKFKRSFDNAVNIYNKLRHNNNRNERESRILESSHAYYSDLYPKYKPELGAIINLKNKLEILRKKAEVNYLNTSRLASIREDFIKLVNSNIKILTSDHLYEYEAENNSVMFSLLDELLAYLDDADFSLARKLNEEIADESFLFDISHLFLRQQNILSNINNKISDVKYSLLRNWPNVIREFAKNHKGANKYNAVRITNDFFAKFDLMKPLAPEAIVSIIVEVFGKEDQRTVNNFIRRNISLLLEKALLLGIQHNSMFHEMLKTRCIDLPSTKRIVLARCYYFLAKYPADESIDERIEFCRIGKNNCNKYFMDSLSKDWNNLNTLLCELQKNKEIKTLGELQKRHTPLSTVNFLYEQFTNVDKLKHLTHASAASTDPRMYSQQLEAMTRSFEQEIKEVRKKGVYIPELMEQGIREFLNGSIQLDDYMYEEYEEERLTIGWGAPLWKEWLSNHSSVRNPLNDGCDFPFRDDVNRFRLLYRIQSDELMSKMIAFIAPNVRQKLQGRRGAKYHYYGWLPQIAIIVKLIVADINQIQENAEIEACIDMQKGTLTIIHKESEPTENVEYFYAKLAAGGGAIFEIAKACMGVCDYHVIANWSDGLKKVNILKAEVESIEKVEADLNPRGFRHVLSFYKPSK